MSIQFEGLTRVYVGLLYLSTRAVMFNLNQSERSLESHGVHIVSFVDIRLQNVMIAF